MSSKNTLRTLKDIPTFKKYNNGSDNHSYFKDVDDLRQEAIKIIKLSHEHYEFIEKFPFKIFNDRERMVIREFVKWQNNITEEDLK